MNIKAHHRGFPVWTGAQADVDRIETLWSECLAASGGPFLFGEQRTIADAMYAPDCTRVRTYDVKLATAGSGYVEAVLAMPEMVEWTAGAHLEPEDLAELEMEF
jgi:glutathione S-transferase